MSPRGNKSKGKPSTRTTHFRTDTNPDTELQDSAFDEKPGALYFSDSESDNEEERKPRETKEERKKKKFTVMIGGEKGVGASNRDMSSKEKKYLKKGVKKMAKMERKEREREEKLKVENEEMIGKGGEQEGDVNYLEMC